MKCTRRELDGNVQVVASGGLFLSEAEWLSKQRTSDGEIKSVVVKTRVEQLPTLAVWLPCTGEEHCSISGSVLLQKTSRSSLSL